LTGSSTPKKAPASGPIIIPKGKKKKPTAKPITLPHIPKEEPPERLVFHAGIILSSTRGTSKTITTSARIIKNEVPKGWGNVSRSTNKPV